jgi:hypothetical protein
MKLLRAAMHFKDACAAAAAYWQSRGPRRAHHAPMIDGLRMPESLARHVIDNI